MTTTLVLPDYIATPLRQLVRLDVESAGVLLTRPVRSTNGDLRLLATRFLPVPDSAYIRRSADELLITSDGYVPALGIAEEASAVPIWLHTHPGDGSSPRASRRDHVVDAELADTFRLRTGSEYYGALILSYTGESLRFTGHVSSETAQTAINRLLTVGSRIALSWNDHDHHAAPPSSLFDRSIRAFGGGVQSALGDLQVAVVGAGGTGSSVAEQLVRLGVRHLVLIDPDELTESNLTRVYGSLASDVGRPKVESLRDHLIQVAPDLQVEPIKSMITTEATARHLSMMDVVFGCTDDNAGRLVLSRLTTYMLVPVIDCGVVLTNDADGRLEGIYGRVTVLHPGAACLVCRGRVDLARAGSEMLTPEERIRRVDEGYAPALEEVEPAVVSYTTAVAAAAVGELIERLIGFGPEPAPSEILLRIHDREISTNAQEPLDRHYCHMNTGKLGLGETEPFLEQTWAA